MQPRTYLTTPNSPSEVQGTHLRQANAATTAEDANSIACDQKLIHTVLTRVSSLKTRVVKSSDPSDNANPNLLTIRRNLRNSRLG